MDHAIDELKERMIATIFMYRDDLSFDEIESEIQAYIEAINILEVYYYSEKKTRIEQVRY